MDKLTRTQLKYENTLAFATEQDAADPLKKYRDQFYFPRMHDREVIYFTGNSLGLQPKKTQHYILDDLEDWATFGVEGQLHARNPWYTYHEKFAGPLAKIVGANASEVTVMNTLSVNLHLLMVSFYRPDKKRYKVLCESNAFPSDRYVIESQLRFHGFDPDDAIIEVAPRQGEHCILQEDILEAIERNSACLALVMLGSINYFNGQAFDVKELTLAAHKAGAIAGFDLAHAAGNIKLQLHDWNVDFAAWCSYKYLNSSPGGISGIFIHERHLNDTHLPRLAGWWGTEKGIRFKKKKDFVPAVTAEGWQLGTAPVLLLAAHKASLDLFDEIGMDALVNKAEKLTGYLEFLIDDLNNTHDHQLEIITPRDKKQRGSQLSIIPHQGGKDFYNQLIKAGVIVNWQDPNVIRCAPVPMYNSFEDVYRFGETIKGINVKET